MVIMHLLINEENMKVLFIPWNKNVKIFFICEIFFISIEGLIELSVDNFMKILIIAKEQF